MGVAASRSGRTTRDRRRSAKSRMTTPFGREGRVMAQARPVGRNVSGRGGEGPPGGWVGGGSVGALQVGWVGTDSTEETAMGNRHVKAPIWQDGIIPFKFSDEI